MALKRVKVDNVPSLTIQEQIVSIDFSINGESARARATLVPGNFQDRLVRYFSCYRRIGTLDNLSTANSLLDFFPGDDVVAVGVELLD